jgi:SecD/SecF fusion protein
MRPYIWKIVICLIPNLLALWFVGDAWEKYNKGEGGFKLGVDLVGGTILVYEIDTTKQAAQTFDDRAASDKDGNTALLASYLKRRIDPNDLYNIVIRMVGKNRVEIILPTGGRQRSEIAQKSWEHVLEEVKDQLEGELTFTKNDPLFAVDQGKVKDLVERIRKRMEEKKWPALLGKKANKDLWEEIITEVKKKRPTTEGKAFDRLKQGDVKGLLNLLRNAPRKDAEEVQGMVRDEAWSAALREVRKEYKTGELDVRVYDKRLKEIGKKLEQIREQYRGNQKALAKDRDYQALSREEKTVKFAANQVRGFTPENREGLITYVLAKGQLFARLPTAIWTAVTPDDPKQNEVAAKREEIAKFINRVYGRSAEDLTRLVNTYYKAGEKKDLTSEEVQKIKDLIARVGKLEFLILANDVDDEKEPDNGVKAADDFLETHPREVEQAAKAGSPPPTPTREFKIQTAKKQTSYVSYRWVEVGKGYRKQLGLLNQNLQQPGTTARMIDDFYNEPVKDRKPYKQIYRLYDRGGEGRAPGYLFIYRRKSENTNLPEEERKKKQYDYFILARKPELDREGALVPKDKDGQPQRKEITGNDLTAARSRPDPQTLKPAVSFEFNSQGARLFGDVTGKNVPDDQGGKQFYRHLAIVLDGEVRSAPTINSVIEGSGQITGDFTVQEVDNLVRILRSGALPATLKPQPVSENTMGATLGEDTIDSGLKAVGIAFAAVLIFMVIYYRFAGFVACVALLSNLLLTVGFMVAVKATFTLPGLAGLVLMLGMAVDANVLIYERLREERDRGASLALAIRNGYDRAFPTIIDTHLTSIFTAIVLYVVGNDQLKGFGVTLTVGLIISLFTSLYMTRLLFDIWQSKGWLHKLSMFRLLSKPNINFMAIRYYWFTATILLTIFGCTMFLIRGKQGLNIDFVGGTAYGGKLVEAKSLTELRTQFKDERQKDILKVDKVKEVSGSDGLRYDITYDRRLGENKTVTVTFVNRPEGSTVGEREDNVRERAQTLPDWSVEQVFLSSEREEDPDTSKYFTVRTVEKEPKLVQTSIDRLLRDKKNGWKSLLEKIEMDFTIVIPTAAQSGGGAEKAAKDPEVSEAHLTFFDPRDKDKPPKDRRKMFASPSFVSTLLSEKLAAVLHKKPEDVKFSLNGEGKTEESRYTDMVLTISEVADPTQKGAAGIPYSKLQKALEETRQAFHDQPLPERLENFDSALAADTRARAVLAIVLSWGAILLFLWFRFGSWTFGLAAVLCLIHDLFFTLGLIALGAMLHATAFGQALQLEDFKLDLTAVAALLTLVGYSVSDTIVVFDRIREVRGKNPDLTPQMINDSVNQTLSRTLLTAFSVWLVVTVLYWFGGPGIHLFAYVMVIGVIVGTYSSIYIASPLLLIFGEGAKGRAAARQRQPQPRPAGSPA